MDNEFENLISLLNKCIEINKSNPSEKDLFYLRKMAFQVEKVAGIANTTLSYLAMREKNQFHLNSVIQVADLLKKSPDFIKDQIKSGRIRALLIGREYRISETALQSYLDQCAIKNSKY